MRMITQLRLMNIEGVFSIWGFELAATFIESFPLKTPRCENVSTSANTLQDLASVDGLLNVAATETARHE